MYRLRPGLGETLQTLQYQTYSCGQGTRHQDETMFKAPPVEK